MVGKNLTLMIMAVVFFVAGFFSTRAWAEEPETVQTSENCSSIKLEDIPVADFHHVSMNMGYTLGGLIYNPYNYARSNQETKFSAGNGTREKT